MVLIQKEKLKSKFKGTIIDIETIGEFSNKYEDSRKYKQIHSVIFGFIDNSGLYIFCAKNKIEINQEERESHAHIFITRAVKPGH